MQKHSKSAAGKAIFPYLVRAGRGIWLAKQAKNEDVEAYAHVCISSQFPKGYIGTPLPHINEHQWRPSPLARKPQKGEL